METVWNEAGPQGPQRRTVRAPVTLVVSAFAPVRDSARTLRPLWSADGESVLVLLAPGAEHRLGGSILETVTGRADGMGWGAWGAPPDVDPDALCSLLALVRRLARRGLLKAYHDRSDGGLVVSVLEMAFASSRGVDIEIPSGLDPVAALFAEEAGAVVEVARDDLGRVLGAARRAGLYARAIGRPRNDRTVRILGSDGAPLFEVPLRELRGEWSRLSCSMRALRDSPESAREAYEAELRAAEGDARTGLGIRLPQGFRTDPEGSSTPARAGRRAARPRAGILREEGTNGHLELAEAFARAGFVPIDLPMSALHEKPALLSRIDVLAAGGGFSYGDVLGGGRGWALALARDPRLRRALARFLADPGKLALGICNGCQMFSALADLTREEGLVPGTEGWPRFVRNRSRRFESRWVNLAVREGGAPTPWLAGMEGALLPVPVAHGEGRAVGRPEAPFDAEDPRIVLRYADALGARTEAYPANPNGSPEGAAGLVNDDGRILILMPHPERAFRALQETWRPSPARDEDAPWIRLFRNARLRLAGERPG